MILLRLPLLNAWFLLALSILVSASYIATWRTRRPLQADRYLYLAVGVSAGQLAMFYALAIVIHDEPILLQRLSRLSIAALLATFVTSSPFYRSLVKDAWWKLKNWWH